MPPAKPTPEDKRLADALSALSNPVRLTLIRQLRDPHVLKELKVSTPSSGRERPMSRQSVKEHLDRLISAGAVAARETERSYGPTIEYVVDHQRLFSLAEEFRELASVRPSLPPNGETILSEGSGDGLDLDQPTLVLVRGLSEGRTFRVDPDADGTTEWIIGRSLNVSVPLDFDPYVSKANSRIWYEDGTHFIEDLEESRNGTQVNWAPLGESTCKLATGDIIGVGRSLLVFRG